MLIKIMEDILNSMKLPIKIIGIEKNNDRNKGININANGIKNLNDGSNVSEYEIQYSPKRKNQIHKMNLEKISFLKMVFFCMSFVFSF